MGYSVINHCANTNGFTKYTQSREGGAQMASNYWHLNFICGKGHQETINVCSTQTKVVCGQDGYDYLYGTLATERCHLNPECEFLKDYCSEISDYANAPSEIEKQHIYSILKQRTNDPETELIARIISSEAVSPEELKQLIQKTVKILNKSSNDKFMCAWILRSISRYSQDFAKLVVEENAVPDLIKLLESTDIDLQEQAILALGNIIGSYPDFRDICIKNGFIEPLIKIIDSSPNIKTLRHSAWLIMNIFRQDKALSLSSTDMDSLLSTLSKLVEFDDIFILSDTFWGIWAFANENSTNIQILLDHGIVKSVITHLSHENQQIQFGALRAVIDFSTGTKEQAQYLLDNGILSLISNQLESNNKHVLFFLNTLITRHPDFISDLFKAELIPSIIDGLISEQQETQINSLFGIHSIVEHGTTNQTIKLIQINTVFNLCKFLT
uniref:Importin subunit alpha n=1 Tax=Panagrolaimus sp. ES5 TaxID=591445 RepID=A0AC34FY35_9BILA